MYYTLTQLYPYGSLPDACVSVSRQSSADFCNGICEPPASYTPHVVLVLSFPSQFRAYRDFRQSLAGYGTVSRGGRVLQSETGRVQVGTVSQR